MKVFDITRKRVHPDEPHLGTRSFGLSFFAGSRELAEEILRIHGIDYEELHEVCGMYEPTPDGWITHYDEKGKTFDENLENGGDNP